MDRKSFELLYHDAVEALISRHMHDAPELYPGDFVQYRESGTEP